MVFLSKVSGNILKARLQLQHTAPGQPHGPLGCTFRDTDVRTWLADGDHSRRVGIEERDAARPAGVGSLCVAMEGMEPGIRPLPVCSWGLQ